jgi:hypothetical protein
MLKRYLVFTYSAYYPGGGWTDFLGSYATALEALEAANKSKYENKEVIDSETLEDIYKYDVENT